MYVNQLTTVTTTVPSSSVMALLSSLSAENVQWTRTSGFPPITTHVRLAAEPSGAITVFGYAYISRREAAVEWN